MLDFAKINEAKVEIHKKSAHLNKLFMAFEERLAIARLGVEVWLFDEPLTETSQIKKILGYARCANGSRKWGLCVKNVSLLPASERTKFESWDDNIKPICESSRVLRILAAHQLPRILERLCVEVRFINNALDAATDVMEAIAVTVPLENARQLTSEKEMKKQNKEKEKEYNQDGQL